MCSLKLITLLTLITITTKTWSQQSACDFSEESESKTLKIILDSITDYKSVDDFLLALPESMKKNYVFIADSRSFQTGTIDSPRVLLQSPGSTIRLSFSLNKNLRGGNNIEISTYNSKTREFDYKEVVFSSNKPTKLNVNPLACIICHGDPEKPNWEPGPSRAGIIPSSNSIFANQKETDIYLSYLQQMRKDGTSRLKFLTPQIDEVDLRNQLQTKKSIPLNFDDFAGNTIQKSPAEQLYQKLNQQNRCVQQQRIEKKSSFETIKYLLYGLDEGNCDLNKLVPSWYSEMMLTYFQGVISAENSKKLNITKKNLFSVVLKNTEQRQNKSIWDRIARLKSFHTKANNLKPVKNNISLENATDITKYRLFLEPIYIDVGKFSTAIDGENFSFGGSFVHNYLSDQIKKEIEKEANGNLNCEWLEKKSLASFEALESNSQMVKHSEIVNEDSIEVIDKINELKQTGRASSIVVNQMAQVALKMKCLGCHHAGPNGQTVSGAPAFPFNDSQLLGQKMNSREGKIQDLRGLLKARINRHPTAPGAMPITKVINLEIEEKAFLNIWLDRQFTDKK